MISDPYCTEIHHLYHTVTTYHTVALASTTVLPDPRRTVYPFTRVGLGSHRIAPELFVLI